jgi:hypothetical protein
LAQYPEKRLPPFLADAARKRAQQARDDSRTLRFAPLRGKYVSKHFGGKNVDILCVTDWFGADKALLFKTPLNEDLDGAPESYAPPVSATDVSPRGGLHTLDNIKNATDKKGTVFHDDPALNTFEWTGVVSAKSGRIDNRPFLRDVNKTFPVFQPANSATSEYYEPQTAIMGIDGKAVNPLEVPYAALSTALRDNGHVSLGDFGVAIRPRTGSFTGFVYADAAGRHSNSVGECSRKTIRNLFSGPATEEEICYIVFPGSLLGNLVNPGLIAPQVQQLLADLAQFDNALYLVINLLWPHLQDTMAAMQSDQDIGDSDPFQSAPAFQYVRPPSLAELMKTPPYPTVLEAMRRAGFAVRT